MTPEGHLVWWSAGCAAFFWAMTHVVIGAFLGASLASWDLDASASLAAVPAAALAAVLSVRLVLSWWHGVGRLRGWPAEALSLRIVALGLLLFAPLVAVCVALAVLVLRLFAVSPEPLMDALQWSTAIAVYEVLTAVLLGGIPALLIELLLCKRFLRAMETPGMAP